VSEDLDQFTIVRTTSAYWRIAFDHPPINLVDPDTIRELQRIVGRLEADADVRVVVFESAHPDYWLARYDLSRAADMPIEPGPTGLPAWIDMTTRLARLPVVSIASIRGRARGAGSEFGLACDLRFASREKAVFGQPEVPAGILPGGGAIERLSLLAGRARTLEIILGGDDFDAPTAERYGWINRCLPDAELDAFVDNLARRIGSFDTQAIAEAKRLINRHGVPDAAELLATQEAFLVALASPGARARGLRARERAAAIGPAEFELRLGHHIGTL
jgi:enoyl-CoA hydratase/carnithine racemase